MGIKQHNGNTGIDRLAELKIRSASIQLATIGAIGLNAIVFSPLIAAADLGSQNGTSITVNDGDRITGDSVDSSGSLYGVMTPTGNTPGNINLGNNVTVNVNAPTGYAKGIILQGNNSTLTANQLTVDVVGQTAAVGINLNGDYTHADLGTGSTIKSNGDGVIVGHSSALLASQLSIENSNGTGLKINDYGSSADLGSGSQIKTNGGPGVYIGGLNGNSANGVARFTATDLTIDVQGYSALGINVQRNSVVDLGTNSTIKTNGGYAHGIWSFGQLSANALAVEVNGTDANGIEVRGGITTIGAGSHISSNQGGGLVTNGTGATIHFSGTPTQRNSIFSGGSYGASAQSATAVINMQNTDIAVDRNGSLALGLWTLSGGKIAGDNLTITGAAGTRGVYAMTNSQIDLTNDLVINMSAPDQMAIATQHNDGYAASRINASGHMLINGSVLAKGGLINLDMHSGSVWTGSSFSDNINGGKLDVALNNSVWNVTSHSSLDTLALTHSTVDFASRASTASTFTTLNVANLSGNSTFIMRADVVGEGDGVNNAGDLLNISGSSAGNHVLTIRNQGSEATTGNEVLTVVQTPDGAASFTASSQVELGGYLYDVRKNGTNWELYASGTAPEPIPDPIPDPAQPPVIKPEPSPVPAPKPTTTADAGGNYLNVGYLMNYVENRTLMQRMGDLRNQSKEGNIWLRGYGGNLDSFASGKLSGFDMGYSGIQFGGDKRLSDEIPLYVGLFIGSTHASPDYRGGDGIARSDYMGMYTSYMAESGFYSDLVVKASRQKNSFHVLDSQNNGVSASGNANGFSASLEAGQKFSLNQPGHGFYIEPQAQFTYSHQNDMDMKASNGLNIHLSQYKSMLGRASIILGYDVVAGNSQLNMYVKTGGIREFSGDTEYRLNRSREKHSFKGNGWNNGVGVSAQFNKQHTLYLEADYTQGNAFDQKQVSGGYRFSF
ncbi:TPA: autotransporter outer membrane beta-barrel domain-containing protein [Citrobacter farmeri]|nr:autotransporter outer membrane beta-barrel domain-containing protein [Citrobacter farmeri]